MSNTALPLLSVRVACKRSEAEDISSYELVSTDGGALPAFSAGSHIDVHLPNAAGGLVRQYSLCNHPGETHRYLIGVLKDAASRGGSQAMHEAVIEGQQLQISPPKNHFALAEGSHRSLLLAGGIGITPLLCMAEALNTAGADFEFHYAARTRSRAAFIERLAQSPFAGRVQLHFDDEAAAQQLQIADLLAKADASTHLYVCGPRGFMDAVLNTARSQGWPEQRLHYEFFAGEVQHSENDGSFEVEVASSGKVITVAKDQTIVKALGDAGIEVMVSCEQGVCGTCLTRVKSGVPDHRDSYLTPEEQAANDQMLLCCSRAKSARLVLDL